MIIKLTEAKSKTTVLANPSEIIRVKLINEGETTQTRVNFTGGLYSEVIETPDEIYAMIQPPIKPAVAFQYEIKLTHKETNLPIYLNARSIESIESGTDMRKRVSTYVRTNNGQVYRVLESIEKVKQIRDEALGLTIDTPRRKTDEDSWLNETT